ncbi:carbohydrate kinase family protein [Elizabethkingia miricola]|uniref:Carbohydrate kinase n=1 Tax=Elizabethkingia miricola TaxID=172045 RepID=A0ABD5B7W1_ELIMR|nr:MULTISPECIES: carbohydrate kinase [Elizabethkingia]MDQ8749508.1 carbohydrate kinase [Elizabethkingia miricola]NHQ65351.1 carbohydrate kinase [Elizabethkingia miricola]NHQ69429.1 carbohydrate kinase [Elizabethkingia miricola]NHQ77277.1 carbohydrate kinase [Elizabethkingia miricola]OPB92251.1 ribokinase [Elizabethkingia miricola]
MKENKIKIACYGEVLWDIFPGGQRRAGGAPFNVAYHLSRMGVDAHMISSVGSDDLGSELLEKIQNWNIPINGIQINNQYPTSTVVATIDENNDAHYDIIQHVAWDYIETRPADLSLLTETDALVFGTLAARSEKSKNTLFELTEASDYNVFDINLRPPYYDIHLIKDLLHRTQLAKFNKAELRMMLDFMGKDYITEKDSIQYLQDVFGMKEIIISKGSKGALYANEDNFYLYPTVSVEVKDTVGSGDSFLAGFLSKRLETGTSAHQIMHQAVALGAFITAQEGACPEYLLGEFTEFRDQHQVSALPL